MLTLSPRVQAQAVQEPGATLPPKVATAGGDASGQGPPAPTKDLEWKFAWEGWDGLHYKLVRHFRDGGKVMSPGEVPVLDFSKVAFQGKFGGKFAGDAAGFWNEENLGAVGDGSEVRRARIYWTGDLVLLAPWSFSLEAGKTGRKFTLEESYIVLKSFPKLGELKAGQFQAPMSLEANLSSRDLTFMEPSSAVMALAPGNNTGLQLSRAAFAERMTWALGYFVNAPASDTGDATRQAERVMGRVTWLARESEEGSVPSLLHLGASGSHLFAGDDTVRYRSQPESHLAPNMVDTGEIAASGSNTLGFEGAWVRGPASVQGEYLRTWVNRGGPGELKFWGAYIGASWLLTGESRPYSRSRGIFTRLAPAKSFSLKRGGRGALELAARFSVVDLNAGQVRGGKMRSLTAGLNWYLNPNLKVRFNWVTARSEAVGPPSRLSVAQVRLEYDF